jgi:aconitate hydratase 2/2-methylisocitrate dehydratase
LLHQKEVSVEGQGLTAVEKKCCKNGWEYARKKVLHAGSPTFVLPVNLSMGSQDTTGLMTSQNSVDMAATVISPIVDGAHQSSCHTASVWDNKSSLSVKLIEVYE